jgi:shikimate kinase
MNQSPQRIFLVGFMGAGKTTVGKELAKKLKYKFVDLDEQIKSSKKKSISTIFETEGESAFRVYEQNALFQHSNSDKIVIAVGGGCATYENNMSWMNEHGTTIYLFAHPGIIFHRLAQNKTGRPLIENKSDIELMQYINDLMEIRHTFYNQAQHKENAAQTVSEIVTAIVSKIKN